MASELLQSVSIASPATTLRQSNLSPAFGVCPPRQPTRFPRRTERNRDSPGVRIRCSRTRVSRERGGLTDEDAAAAASFFGGSDLAAEEEEEEDEEFSDDEDQEEDDQESSLDLLIRFLQSMFRKAARRAKRASRSVMPPTIQPQLVSFAVDGILLLALLSIVKAILEVACTLGGTVFAAILLVRVIWAALSYFQSNSSRCNQAGRGSGFDTGQHAI